MSISTILWYRHDVPGMESARLASQDSGWVLEGTAVFAHGELPCRLSYMITLTATWETASCNIGGWIGGREVAAAIRVDGSRQWLLDGQLIPEVVGCIDIDLNFSPSTNLLPLRRLNLVIGQSADVTAAWLRFPSLELQPLPQTYHRLTDNTFRYESAGGRFVRDLKTHESGLVTDYPGFWSAEAVS